MIARLRLMLGVLGRCFRLRPVATVVVIVIMVVNAVSGTLFAVLQGALVQQAPGGDLSGLVSLVGLAAVLLAFDLIAWRIGMTLQRDVADAAELSLIEDLMRWSARPASVDHLQDPEFLDRLSVIVRRTNGLAHAMWSAILLASCTVSVIVSLTVLARIHPALTGLALLSVPPILLAGKAGNLYIAAVDSNADLLRLEERLTDSLTGASLPEVMVAGSAVRLDERAQDLWRAMAHYELKARGQAVILTSLGWLIYGARAALAVAWTIRLARAGATSLGNVAVVAGLAVLLAEQIMNVLNFRVQAADSGRVLDHYGWVAAQTAELAPRAEPMQRIETELRLDEVSYAYPGSSDPSLAEVSLQIPAGTVLGIVGVNGAGKSTLARILAGLSQPSAGRVLVDGELVRPGALTGAATGTFQDYARLELVAREAVGTADLERARRDSELADAAGGGGAAAVVAGLEAGWQTQLGSAFDGAELSQGQWQRVALSRGLFKTAPLVLLLDEPTAALDPQSEHDLFAAFASRARQLADERGTITVLVSHRFSTVTMTDLIVVLEAGRVVETGSHAALMSAGATYRRLFDAQARGYHDAGAAPVDQR